MLLSQSAFTTHCVPVGWADVVVVVVVVVVFVVVVVRVGETSGVGTPRTTRSRSDENAPEARIVADERTVAASGLPIIVRKLC